MQQKSSDFEMGGTARAKSRSYICSASISGDQNLGRPGDFPGQGGCILIVEGSLWVLPDTVQNFLICCAPSSSGRLLRPIWCPGRACWSDWVGALGPRRPTLTDVLLMLEQGFITLDTPGHHVPAETLSRKSRSAIGSARSSNREGSK